MADDDFASDMYRKIQCIDNFRAKQASISAEEHALSDAWHNSLLYALMLEIIRKVLLLGSEGVKNSYHFDLTDERFSMLGIREKDVRRCREVLKNKLLKNLDNSGMVVNEIEIGSSYEEGKDAQGNCYIKWDIEFLPEIQ